MFIERELTRYQTNGPMSTLISAAIWVAFFTQWMPFCKLMWPWYLKIGEDYGMEPLVHADFWLSIQSFII
jgi:thiol-disulfide isomerase/thioredoxin